MIKNEKKTILVTGGAGFLGSHLCEKYLNEGQRVIAVDNLQTTFTSQNIDHLHGNRDFLFIKHDIIEPLDIAEKIDWIFNFGCPAQCVNLQWDPIHTLKTSVHGVINMLELAHKHTARIMQASTSEIYGHNPKNPQVETDCGAVYTLGPRACYDEGKRVSETLLMDHYRQYGTDVKIIRIFNTYGPRMYVRDGRVMSNFIIPALAGKPITIYGDGSYTRSFQYVDDILEGIDRMMRKENFLGPVNLGNPHEITIKELAETIIRLTGSDSEIIYKEKVTDDPVRRQPDINLARKELDWEPKVSLEEGIKKTIEYFRTVEMPEKKILVFSTTYFPHMGPAEKALHELTKLMPDAEFHIITTKSNRKLLSFEKIENNFIYRLGNGNIIGKYLYPLRSARKARDLGHLNKFRFAWSIMASYGALGAILFKRSNKNINFLISFDKSELEKRNGLKAKLLNPLMKWILKKADSVYISDIDLEKNQHFFDPDTEIKVMDNDGQGFVDQVRRSYTYLLNQQEKKLDRPI
jgi:UDP-glucuronate decarboxylase